MRNIFLLFLLFEIIMLVLMHVFGKIYGTMNNPNNIITFRVFKNVFYGNCVGIVAYFAVKIFYNYWCFHESYKWKSKDFKLIHVAASLMGGFTFVLWIVIALMGMYEELGRLVTPLTGLLSLSGGVASFWSIDHKFRTVTHEQMTKSIFS